MKISIPVLTALLVTAGTAGAQPPRGGLPRLDMDRMAILLDLDDYQKSEVERVLNEQREAGVAMREQLAASGERPSREEMQAHREQMQQDTLTKLQAVLTEQQLVKFQVLTERGDGARRARRRDADN